MTPRLLIANPSADVYGSDLQMLESVTAAVERGWQVTVTTPTDGPLVSLLEERGATVRLIDYPVVRRSDASLRGMADLGRRAVRAIRTIRAFTRDADPDVVYVNTVTLPWWIVAARLARRPVVVHVHEAEEADSRPVRFALYGPLMAATALVVNSRTALRVTTESAPFLKSRSNVIFNGVRAPAATTPPPDLGTPPVRLACVGRLSPRKGTDIALEAVAILRDRGHEVRLEVGGTVFPGYEWFEEQLRARAEQPDLSGVVDFAGYVSPVTPLLERAHIVLAPSLRESFGNVVVEAQLCGRPVIATATTGHLETVQDGVTGLHVEPGSPVAIADAVERLLADPALAESIADGGRRRSSIEYSPERYRSEVMDLLERLARGR